MTTEEENLLLLHWSGELTSQETEEVNALLKESEDARAFSAQLSRQADLIRESNSGCSLPRDIASAAVGSFEKETASAAKTITFPFFPALAAAAAILLAAFFLLRPSDIPPEIQYVDFRDEVNQSITDLEAEVAAFQQESSRGRYDRQRI